MAPWMLSGGPKASSLVGFNLTADLASSFLYLPSSLAGLFFLPMVILVYSMLINRARGDFGYLVHLLFFPFYRQTIWSLEFLKFYFIKSGASTTTLVKESLTLLWVMKNGKMEGRRICSVHCHWSLWFLCSFAWHDDSGVCFWNFVSAMCVYKGTFSVPWVLTGMWQDVDGCEGTTERTKEGWVCDRNVGLGGDW